MILCVMMSAVTGHGNREQKLVTEMSTDIECPTNNKYKYLSLHRTHNRWWLLASNTRKVISISHPT